MTILDFFNNNVARLGNGPCLHYKSDGGWRSLSWNEVSEKISLYAANLASLGVKEGDRVGILSSTRIEWTLADMAILSIGAVSVPIYHSITKEQVDNILKDCGVSVLFVENKTLLTKIDTSLLRHIIIFDELKEVTSGQHPTTNDQRPTTNDVASIIYTSGTTGEPKGAIITHENIMAEVDGLKKVFSFGKDEISLVFLPLAHVVGRVQQFYQLAQGCQAAYAESMDKLSQNFLEVRPHFTVIVPRVLEKIYDRIMETINSSKHWQKKIFSWAINIGQTVGAYRRKGGRAPFLMRLKYFLAVVFVFSRIHKKLGGQLRLIISGGAPLASHIAKFFHSASLLVLEGYGLTETMAAVAINRVDDYHFGTVGKPLHGVNIKLAQDCEILVKGGPVFKGYWRHEDDTKQTFTDDGWFKTGDIGEFSKDGFLRITDRKKDIIVTAGGKNIAPQAIEALLLDSPYISNAMVYGDKRPYLTALVTLNTQEVGHYASKKGIGDMGKLSSHPQIKELISSVIEEKNRKLASFETIKKFAILDHDFAIEKGELTPTMKVRRRMVAEKYKDVLEGLYG